MREFIACTHSRDLRTLAVLTGQDVREDWTIDSHFLDVFFAKTGRTTI